MAITYDNSAKSTIQSALASGTAFTWSHTAAAGTYCLVAVFGSTSGTPVTPAATANVTIGSATLTSLGTAVQQNNQSTAGTSWLFGGYVTGSGAQTVSVTFTQSGNTFSGYGTSYTYLGVGSVGTLKTSFGSGTTPSLSVPSATGDMVFGGICSNSTTAESSFSLANTRQSASGGGSMSFIAGDGAGAASVTVSATSGNQWWCCIGIDVQPSSSASPAGLPPIRIPNPNIGPPALRQRFRFPTRPRAADPPLPQYYPPLILPNPKVGPPALRRRFRFPQRLSVLISNIAVPPAATLTLTGGTPIIVTANALPVPPIVLPNPMVGPPALRRKFFRFPTRLSVLISNIAVPPAASLTLAGGTPQIVTANALPVPPINLPNPRVGPPALRNLFRFPTRWTVLISNIAVPPPATLTLTGGVPQIVTANALPVPPIRIANRNVGPAVLRQRFRQPTPQVASSGITVTPTGATLTLTGGTPLVGIDAAGAKMPPVRIANRNVGPAVLRSLFRLPQIWSASSQNVTVTPTAATLTLTGGTPVIDTGIVPPAGVLTLTGSVPGITITDTRMPPTRIATAFVGPSALRRLFRNTVRWTVITPFVLTPPAATLTLTGSTPVIDTGIVPTGATVTLTGGTPTVAIIDGGLKMPPVRIANPFVGPSVLRRLFRLPRRRGLVDAVAVQPPPPPSIGVVFVVQPENRTTVIPAEIRVTLVAAELRTTVVPADPRGTIIPPENRTTVIPAPT